MKPAVSILLLLVGTVLTGCSKSRETYAIMFRSIGGELLATGTIELRSSLPSHGKVTAAFILKMGQVSSRENDVVWFYRLFDGINEGELEWSIRPPPHNSEPPHTLEFMPRRADANIQAQISQFTDGKASGSWSYARFDGIFVAGSVEMEKK